MMNPNWITGSIIYLTRNFLLLLDNKLTKANANLEGQDKNIIKAAKNNIIGTTDKNKLTTAANRDRQTVTAKVDQT